MLVGDARMLRDTAAADEWAYVTQPPPRAAFRPGGSPPRGLPSAMPTRRRMDHTEETVRRERRPLVADLAVGTVGLCIHRFVPCQTLQRDASVEWLQLQTDLLGLCAPPVCTDAAQKLPGEIVEWELEEMVDVPPGSVRWARLGELLSSGIPHEAEAALTLIEAQSGARLGQAVVNLATMLDKGHELHGVELPVHAVGATRGGRLLGRLTISLAAVATLDAAAAEVAPPGTDFASVRGESAEARRQRAAGGSRRRRSAPLPPIPRSAAAGGRRLGSEHEAEGAAAPRAHAVARPLVGAAPPRRVRRSTDRGSAPSRLRRHRRRQAARAADDDVIAARTRRARATPSFQLVVELVRRVVRVGVGAQDVRLLRSQPLGLPRLPRAAQRSAAHGLLRLDRHDDRASARV